MRNSFTLCPAWPSASQDDSAAWPTAAAACVVAFFVFPSGVIPQDVRTRLGLTSGTELEIDVEGDVIRLAPVRTSGRTLLEVDGLLVVAPVTGITTTDRDVQRWRDADQR